VDRGGCAVRLHGGVDQEFVLVDLRIRTDSGDATTQDTISAGSIEVVAAPRHSGGVQDGGSGTRFLAGDTIAYLQVVSGTGPALLTFVR
jgi:hypothetical protein